MWGAGGERIGLENQDLHLVRRPAIWLCQSHQCAFSFTAFESNSLLGLTLVKDQSCLQCLEIQAYWFLDLGNIEDPRSHIWLVSSTPLLPDPCWLLLPVCLPLHHSLTSFIFLSTHDAVTSPPPFNLSSGSGSIPAAGLLFMWWIALGTLIWAALLSVSDTPNWPSA